MNTPKAEYKEPFTLRCCTRQELADLYEISLITMRRWIKRLPEELGMKGRHILDALQVKAIIEKYGVPGEIVLK